jgi:tetratricopeptide (TPR) repeat protein
MAKYCLNELLCLKRRNIVSAYSSKKIIIIFFFIFLSTLFYSCSYAKLCYENLSAVYAAEKGGFDKSIVKFNDILKNNSAFDIKKYIEYNISVVYMDMGELIAAEKNLLSIKAQNNAEFLYRINYQLGVIAFLNGEYRKAAKFFKDAIIIDNSDVKLIKNLELSFFMINNKNNDKQIVGEFQEKDSNNAFNKNNIFELMYSKGEMFWLEKNITEKSVEKDW